MEFNFYSFIAIMSSLIFSTIPIGIITYTLVIKALSFINDKKPDYSKLSLIISSKFNWSINNIYDIIIFLCLIWILILFGSLLWPLSIIILVITGILHLLRSFTRTGKKIKKIGDYIHDHPETVEKTKVDIYSQE